jgi:hypothetical protein
MSNVQGLRLLVVAPLNCNGEDHLPDVGPWTGQPLLTRLRPLPIPDLLPV